LFEKQQLLKKEAPAYYENDISAQGKAAKKGARFQKENAHEKRTQCFKEKTCEGKKKTYSIKTAKRRCFCFAIIAGRENVTAQMSVQRLRFMLRFAGGEYAKT
jgi:hypothetical protein